MHLIIYRYEGEDKKGPYHTRKYIESVHMADHTNRPAPHWNRYKAHWDSRFGFVDRNQVRSWFDKTMRKDMRRESVRLRVYKVPYDALTYSDEYQVAFDIKKAQQLI